MSLTEWAVRLGVASIREITIAYWKKMDRGVPGKHVTFDGKKEWMSVAREGADEFSANRSLGVDIKDHVLRLAQIYIGFNLLGQGSCITKVSLTELYFMRKIQKGEGVNLAYWLTYQAHQINRSKSRHLNLCHIVGVFIRNNMELIHARQGLITELCMIPRHFNLDFLIEHKIVRVLEGKHVFYEPGKVTPKTHNRTNIVQALENKEEAKVNDKYTLEWLVNEHLDLRMRVDVIYDRVTDTWKAMKRSRAGAASSKAEEKEAMETEAGDDVVEEEVDEEDKEGEDANNDEDGNNNQEKSVEEEEPTEADQSEKEDEAETVKLVPLAIQAVMLGQRRAKEKTTTQKEAAGASSAPSKKPPTSKAEKSPKKRKDPSQGSPDARTLRSKRRR